MRRLALALVVAAIPAVACRPAPPPAAPIGSVAPADQPAASAGAAPCYPDRDHAIAADLWNAAMGHGGSLGGCRVDGERVIDDGGRVVATVTGCGIEMYVPGFQVYDASEEALPIGQPLARLHLLATPAAPLVCTDQTDGQWCAFEDGDYDPVVAFRVRDGVIVSASASVGCD
jgi:hypothetical protein